MREITGRSDVKVNLADAYHGYLNVALLSATFWQRLIARDDPSRLLHSHRGFDGRVGIIILKFKVRVAKIK